MNKKIHFHSLYYLSAIINVMLWCASLKHTVATTIPVEAALNCLPSYPSDQTSNGISKVFDSGLGRDVYHDL